MLRKGVLMGDPLTKPVLHLVNILVRITGENLSKPAFVDKVFGNAGSDVMHSIRKVFSPKTDKLDLLPRTVSTAGSSDLNLAATPTVNAVFAEYRAGNRFKKDKESEKKPTQEIPPDPGELPVPAVRPLYNPHNLQLDWRVVLGVTESYSITNQLAEPVHAQQRNILRLSDPRISHLLDTRDREHLRARRDAEKRRISEACEDFTFREMFVRPTIGETPNVNYTRLPGSIPAIRARSSQRSNHSEPVTCTRGFMKLFGLY